MNKTCTATKPAAIVILPTGHASYAMTCRPKRRSALLPSVRLLLSFVLAGLAPGLSADNLRELVVAAGENPLQGHAHILSPQQETVAARAFDGVATNAAGDNARCLGESGMFVTFGFPASLVPDGKKLAVTRYRVYQLNGGTSAHLRAPRAWTLSGSMDNSAFTPVDERADITWYADSHTIGDHEALPPGVSNWHEYSLSPSAVTDWRYLRFTPTKSKAVSGWVYAFEEIEFYGTVYDPAKGYCEVEMPDLRIGAVEPAYGAVTPTGAVFRVASGTVQCQGVTYELEGWRLQKWNGAEWVTADAGTSTEYEYVPDGSIARFSWNWQITSDCDLSVKIEKDVGCERVTCSPASETGAYRPGTEVTLTAVPATSPYPSRFVCWRGDLPDGVDAASPVITITMNGRVSLEAVFDRSDWGWFFMSEGGAEHAGLLTDGRWKFRVSATTEDASAGSRLDEIVFGDGVLDLRRVRSDANLDLLAITNRLFQDHKTLSAVFFNDELRRIGSYAFDGATAMRSAAFGTGLSAIGDRAFQNTGLSGTVDLSRCVSVTKLENDTFYNNQSIEEVILPPRLRQICWRALASMPKLRRIRCTPPPPEYRYEMKHMQLVTDADPIGGSVNLESVEFPCGGAVSLNPGESGSLRGLTALRTLTFNGRAPASLGDLFSKWAQIPPQPAYQLRIVVSPQRDRAGWERLKTRAPTEEEKQRADYPGEAAFGVLDAPAASRAWLVWGESMFDQGFAVLIR